MDSELVVLAVSFGAILVAVVSIYAMRTRGRGKEEFLETPAKEDFYLKVTRSVKAEDAKKAQEELRILDLEREINSYAIRRLYEAQAEGKISEEERERLTLGYKERMLKIKESISKNEGIVALNELEAMQEDLTKLFSERFEEINRRVGDLRSKLEIEPVKKVPAPPSAPPSAPPKKDEKRERKTPAPKKTEAEKRIEEIKAEVEKVLERLGQIEVEA